MAIPPEYLAQRIKEAEDPYQELTTIIRVNTLQELGETNEDYQARIDVMVSEELQRYHQKYTCLQASLPVEPTNVVSIDDETHKISANKTSSPKASSSSSGFFSFRNQGAQPRQKTSIFNTLRKSLSHCLLNPPAPKNEPPQSALPPIILQPRKLDSFTPEPDYLCRITLVGAAGSGKTCLWLRFIEDAYIENYFPTIGQDIKVKDIDNGDGAILKLQIWSSTGEEQFFQMLASMHNKSRAFIIAFNISDRSTFEYIKLWPRLIERNAASNAILAVSKCDLPKEQHQVTKDEIEEFVEQFGLQVFYTSAKSGMNVDALFFAGVTNILQQRPPPPPPIQSVKCKR